MKNSKKSTNALPKNIQLTLITTAAIMLVMNAIYFIGLLVRVYPQGMRLSQFSIMAISNILLPVVLFLIAYVTYKKSTSRFERIFNATLLAIVGAAIYTIVSILERLLTRYHDVYNSLPAATWLPLVSVTAAFALYVGLLLALRTPKKNNDARSLQFTTIILVALAFIATAAFNLSSLVLQHIGSLDMTKLLTHPLLITPVVLPIAFFATAYFTAAKNNGRLNRLFTATIYTLVGILVILITSMLFNLGVWTLSIGDLASIHALDLPTIFTAFLSLAVYTFLIVTHNRVIKSSKKSK